MKSWMSSALFVWGLLVFGGCGDGAGFDGAGLSCEGLAQEVEAEAAQVFDDAEPAVEELRGLARAYADFANRCHDHPLAPEMLFRRADVLLGLGKPQEALAQYRDIHDNFSQFDQRAHCAFFMGFIYDAHLGDRAQATKVYREVLAIYPDSDAAAWSRQALVALGELDAAEPAAVQIDLGF